MLLGDGSEAGEGGGGAQQGSLETYGTPGSGGVAEYLYIDHRIEMNKSLLHLENLNGQTIFIVTTTKTETSAN